jgi:hypothetical protein
MRVFILTSATQTYIYLSVLETSKFWLAPVKDGDVFDIFAKDVFTLTIEDAQEPKSTGPIGFSEN